MNFTEQHFCSYTYTIRGSPAIIITSIALITIKMCFSSNIKLLALRTVKPRHSEFTYMCFCAIKLVITTKFLLLSVHHLQLQVILN